MTDENEDFLRRWSRRKVEARQGLRRKEDEGPEDGQDAVGRDAALRDDAVVESPEIAGAGGALVPEAEQARAVEEDDFADVDFDALDYNSDYTRFMKKGVSAAVQRRALRALWTSDPVLACVDGLNDYDLDYTDAATVVKNLQTSWSVGRGYRTAEEIAADAKADSEAEEAIASTEERAEAAPEEETPAETAEVDGDEPDIESSDDDRPKGESTV